MTLTLVIIYSHFYFLKLFLLVSSVMFVLVLMLKDLRNEFRNLDIEIFTPFSLSAGTRSLLCNP